MLSLDLGSVTGFAVKDSHGISSGTLNFKKGGKFHAGGYWNLFQFLDCFEERFHLNGISYEVIVEKPHAGRFIAPVRILFGLLAIVHLFCDKYGIKLTEYSPKEIKKFWTGTGTAKKPEMVAETQKVFPHIKDHNESDAIAMLTLHLERQK